MRRSIPSVRFARRNARGGARSGTQSGRCGGASPPRPGANEAREAAPAIHRTDSGQLSFEDPADASGPVPEFTAPFNPRSSLKPQGPELIDLARRGLHNGRVPRLFNRVLQPSLSPSTSSWFTWTFEASATAACGASSTESVPFYFAVGRGHSTGSTAVFTPCLVPL